MNSRPCFTNMLTSKKSTAGVDPRSPARLAVLAANLLLCETAVEGFGHSKYYHRWYALTPCLTAEDPSAKVKNLPGSAWHLFYRTELTSLFRSSTIAFRWRI